MQQKIDELEKEIDRLCSEIHELRIGNHPKITVPNYTFEVESGTTTLLDLFDEKEHLLAVHNMGSWCIYCTMWADACNRLLRHLESAISVVLLSPETPKTQRKFAESRDWQFNLASFGNSLYISEQNVRSENDIYPGAVAYQRHGDQILRRNSCVFGLGDLYATPYSILAMCGIGPQGMGTEIRIFE